jgi:general secretion pathway protein A
LLGEAGTGKTTLVRSALALEQRPANRYVLLDNPTLTRSEFYEYLANGLRFSAEAAASKARFLMELRRDVQERHAAGGVTSLIFDEAQSLPYELLEEVRLLANIETATAKLLNVVLSGQPELADRLNETSLRQLKQRVALRCELGPLELRETAAYIAGRLRIAGGEKVNEIFTRDAVVTVHQLAGGIPRTVSVICENALMSGFASGRKPVDADVVQDVAKDFDLEQPATPAEDHEPEAPVRIAAVRGGDGPVAPFPSGAAPTSSRSDEEGNRPIFGTFSRKRRFRFF